MQLSSHHIQSHRTSPLAGNHLQVGRLLVRPLFLAQKVSLWGPLFDIFGSNLWVHFLFIFDMIWSFSTFSVSLWLNVLFIFTRKAKTVGLFRYLCLSHRLIVHDHLCWNCSYPFFETRIRVEMSRTSTYKSCSAAVKTTYRTTVRLLLVGLTFPTTSLREVCILSS